MPTKIPSLEKLEKLKDKWFQFSEIFEENKLSLTYLLMIVLNQLFYGIGGKILTPTGTDLRFVYKVSQFTIDNLNTPLYTGFLFGSFANYLYTRGFNRQLTLVLFVLVMSMSTSATPHVSNIWVLYAVMFANGIGFGVWEAGNSMWLIEVWPQRIAVLFQINQFAYNFGGALSYILTAPFIYGDSLVDGHNRTLTPDDRRLSLSMPFFINGYLQSIIPLIFLALYFINRYQKRSLSKKIHNHNIDMFLPSVFVASNRPRKMILCFIWVFIYLTTELAYINFFGTMYSSLEFSDTEQHYINVIFLISYALGPFLNIFIAITFKLQNIIIFNYVLVTFSLIFLYFGLNNVVFVYACNFFLGLGYGPILPAILAFSEMSLQLNERNVSVYTFVCGAGWLLTPFIARAGFDYLGPFFLFYYNLICIPTSFAFYCIARWWLFHNSKKFSCYIENQQTNLKVCP